MKVIIYEDNDRLRQSLELLIGGLGGFDVVGTWPNCVQCAAQTISLRPDVVIMDIDMPEVNGIVGVSKIKEARPETSIIMFTVFEDDERIFACLEAGADGYLLKKTPPSRLIEAISEVHLGGAPMSPGIARRVLGSFQKAPKDKTQFGLSDREQQILSLLVSGHTYKGIAAECHISIDTVGTHLRNIYHKLHVNSGTEAVAKAIRQKIV